MGVASAAGIFASRKFKIFPLVPGDKRPLTKNGFKDASSDPAIIKKWWEEYPQANIGFPVPENIAVVDVDSEAALQQLKYQDIIELPSTVTVKTPRGYHFWYRLQENQKVVPRVAIFPGVDLRAYGSYVILPPSRLRNGRRYSWKTPPSWSNMSDAPEWLYELGSEKGVFVSDPVSSNDVLKGVSHGVRDVTLFRYACQLRSRNMAREEALTLVLQAAKNCGPPFPEAEAKRKVDQAWKYPIEEQVGEPNKIVSETLDQLMSREVQTPIWLIPDLLVEGLTLLTSPAKLGKSMLISQLAGAVALGGLALNEWPCKKASVAVFDLEQADWLAKERWGKILVHKAPPSSLHLVWEAPTMSGGFLDELEKFTSEHPEIRMVVVDVLSKIWPEARAGFGNAYHKEYRILSALKKFADKNRIAFVLLHHTRKGEQGSDYLASISGSSAMGGVPDVHWFLERKRSENSATLKITGRAVIDRMVTLAWHYNYGGFTVEPEIEMEI